MNENQKYLLTFPPDASEATVYMAYGELTGREPELVIRPDALIDMWFVGKADYGELLDYLDMKAKERKLP